MTSNENAGINMCTRLTKIDFLIGIMKTDDLKFLFKNAAFKPNDIKTYVIDLLNKFEVALLYDEDSLLIPSLLPKEDDLIRGYSQKDVRVSYTVSNNVMLMG